MPPDRTPIPSGSIPFEGVPRGAQAPHEIGTPSQAPPLVALNRSASFEYAGLDIRYPPPWDYRRVFHRLPDSHELWERIKADPDQSFIGLQDAGMIHSEPNLRLRLSCFRRMLVSDQQPITEVKYCEEFIPT